MQGACLYWATADHPKAINYLCLLFAVPFLFLVRCIPINTMRQTRVRIGLRHGHVARYRMATGSGPNGSKFRAIFIGHKLMLPPLYSRFQAIYRANSIKRWKVFLECESPQPFGYDSAALRLFRSPLRSFRQFDRLVMLPIGYVGLASIIESLQSNWLGLCV